MDCNGNWCALIRHVWLHVRGRGKVGGWRAKGGGLGKRSAWRCSQATKGIERIVKKTRLDLIRNDWLQGRRGEAEEEEWDEEADEGEDEYEEAEEQEWDEEEDEDEYEEADEQEEV